MATMMEDWADALAALAIELLSSCSTPDLWQPPAGPYALDHQALEFEAPEWIGKGILERVAFDSTKFVSLALRHRPER